MPPSGRASLRLARTAREARTETSREDISCTTSSGRGVGSCRPCTRPGCPPAAERPCVSQGVRAQLAQRPRERTSAVRPPLVGGWDRAALVLDRDAPQRQSVLASRKACALSSHRDLERGHQLYDLLWSGGGIVPPLYSTGMPPSG